MDKRHTLELIYSDEPHKESHNKCGIFLAGPSPRDEETESWRKEAIDILKSLNFNEPVYIPEWKSFEHQIDYNGQVEWEWHHLNLAKRIVFWVPREMEKMPAMTANVEFGFYLASRPEAVIYGRPDDAPKNKYLDWLYMKNTQRIPHNDLRELLLDAYVQCIKR